MPASSLIAWPDALVSALPADLRDLLTLAFAQAAASRDEPVQGASRADLAAGLIPPASAAALPGPQPRPGAAQAEPSDWSVGILRRLEQSIRARGFAHVVLGGPRGERQVTGTASADWISLGDASQAIEAGFGFDVVSAGGGNDTIRGGGGRDTLEGGTGADRFVFDAYLSAATNIDTIVDFTPAEDQIVLDRAIFTTLNPGSRLQASSLRAGPGVVAATAPGERLLYDSSSGTLAFDRDGSGTVDAPVPFAILANRPVLTSDAFSLSGGPPQAPRSTPRPGLSVGPKLNLIVVPQAGASTSVAWRWVTAATDAVAAGGVKLDGRAGPTLAARFYAMLGTALYEAWQLFDPKARSTLASSDGSPRWDLQPEQQIRRFLQSTAKAGDAQALSRQLIDSVVARTAYAVLSSPLSGMQAGSPGLTRLDQQLQSCLSAITPAQATVINGLDQQLSQQVAAQVLDRFRNDGSSLTLPDLTNPLTLNAPAYVPLNAGPSSVTSIDHWTPEYNVNSNAASGQQVFLTPTWGDVQYYLEPSARIDGFTRQLDGPEPFLLDPKDTYDLKLGLIYDDGKGPGTPITPDQIGRTINPRFIDQANEVVAYNRQLAAPEGTLYKGIAQFWEDGAGTPFPPGTWMNLGQYASLLHDNNLGDDARLFLGLGACLYTASIAAWDVKRQDDYARPVRVIRELSRLGLMQDDDNNPANGSQFQAFVRGQGLQTINGVDWETYQSPGGYSPPFPEYVSGHSTFSAAAADFLTDFYNSPDFGGKVDFKLSFSYDQPDQAVSLAWDTWQGAAQESGFSRLWGGIHFLDGNLSGQELGTAIGSSVGEQLSRLWG